MIIHIIFFLIKLIGTILLVLLGVLVFMLLVILLVPIRYRVRLSHGEKFHLEGTVSWLLHIVHGQITQKGELRRILLRIFGFVIYDSDRPKKPKKFKRGLKRIRLRNQEKKSRDRLHHKTNAETTKIRINPRIDDQETKLSDTLPKEYMADQEQLEDKDGLIYKDELNSKLKTENKVYYENTDYNENTDYSERQKEGKEESLLGKILRRILGRIRRIYKGIKQFICGLKGRFQNLLQKALDLKHKINLIKKFITDEENWEAIRITFGSLKRLVKHILPTKLKSRLTFGTGDPCSTGQALGLIGCLYGFYGEHIQIKPDFENKIFEGSHYARGRIRIGTLLIIVIKLLLDEKFKLLRRNFKILKEAL